METKSATFLQQAHRNNWQQYLASLKTGAEAGWDVCVLTASDEQQAAFDEVEGSTTFPLP